MEFVDVKTAAIIDNVHRYSEVFQHAVSVGIMPMCICRGVRTIRTIGA